MDFLQNALIFLGVPGKIIENRGQMHPILQKNE
jgi:hypothetical protein